MKLHVNGQPQEVDAGLHLAALLEQLQQPLAAVAVAVNLEVVPKGRYAERLLAEGDRVEIVRAVGGG
ncbi:MAG: sulfur carrier protein ThiS [Alphaproteobacteria bacterium]|nr:sulfur carrier protein ThiS [Alphaproteobacteria bacterium]